MAGKLTELICDTKKTVTIDRKKYPNSGLIIILIFKKKGGKGTKK